MKSNLLQKKPNLFLILLVSIIFVNGCAKQQTTELPSQQLVPETAQEPTMPLNQQVGPEQEPQPTIPPNNSIPHQISAGIKACNWVFKTDPTNVGHIDGVLSSDKSMIAAYGGAPSKIHELNNGYFTLITGCNKNFPYIAPKNFVFFKATTLEDFQAYDVAGEGVDQERLKDAIKDIDPFKTLYYCEPCIGTEFENYCNINASSVLLNKMIDGNELDNRCQKII
jgi:hypothetical protein